MGDVPVWLLDVDGVLNASRPGWGGPGRAARVTVLGCSLRLRWEPKAIACIRTLHMAGVVEVRWCTTWCPWTSTLEALWRLPTFGRAWQGDPADTWHAKLEAALDVVADGRRLVWTDDDLDPADLPPELDPADPRLLLIRPRSSRGLRTVRHWEQGRYPIPDGVRTEVHRIVCETRGGRGGGGRACDLAAAGGGDLPQRRRLPHCTSGCAVSGVVASGGGGAGGATCAGPVDDFRAG